MDFDVVTSQHGSFTGTISVDNNARIDGGFDGNINAGNAVVIGVNGSVKGEVRAYNVIIAGKFEGTLVCDGKLVIEKTGSVSGTINIAAVEVHEGGALEGTVVRIAKRAVAPDAKAAAVQNEAAGANNAVHAEVKAPEAVTSPAQKEAAPQRKSGFFSKLSMASLSLFALVGCIYFF